MRPYLLGLVLTPYLLLDAGIQLAQSDSRPQEVQAVQKYILDQDYPELFGSESYRTKIENVLVTDLDGDGNKEVVVLLFPHYRQSAPIIIYRLSKTLEVTRVSEGLAPGPLVSLTNDYLDSHTLGQAVDLQVGSKNGQGAREALLEAIKGSGFGGVVEYKTFIHTDGRKGALSYIDMRDVDVPGGKETCEGFEFSHVESIGAGALENDAGKVYLAAQVGSQLWLYHVDEFSPDGVIRKTLLVEPVPRDFVRFSPSATGVLSYETTAGVVQPLKVKQLGSVPNNALHPPAGKVARGGRLSSVARRG